MSKNRLFRTILLSLVAVLFLCPVSRAKEGTTVDKWIRDNFAKGKTPPFSFTYGGVESSEFIRRWKYSIEKIDTSDKIRYNVSYTDPVTKLHVECVVSGYEDFNAVDWVLNISNESDKDSPQIQNLKAVDYSCCSKDTGPFVLGHIKGSSSAFDDFTPFSDTLAVDSAYVYSPSRGRSSDGMAAPYFKIQTPDGKGLVLAIGWSGTWLADFAKTDDRCVKFSAGMKELDTYLYPGESIRTPLVQMMFWEGKEVMAGNNKFRRFMLAHNMRSTNGQNSQCPTFSSLGWADPAPLSVRTGTTAELAICTIHRFQQFDLHPDYFWLDAGWYTTDAVHNRQHNWHYTSGTWRPDPERFPSGLRPIADEIHKAGSKFLVWFEPERVNKGSQVWELHPEWLLSKPGDDFYHVFDFGNPEARKWMCSYIGDFIEESGIDCYRQDLCLEPAVYWSSNDLPGRKGMKELRHIEGLYAYWDYLLERFPELLIDNCASGGRRLDIEMYRRSIPLWRTDFVGADKYEGSQSHAYGLNFFLPVHAISMNAVDDYSFLSTIGTVAIFNPPLFNNSKLDLAEYWKKVSLYREIQTFFYEDYYPLSGIRDITGHSTTLAYQMHRPADSCGLVLAFRRKDVAKPEIELKLEALQKELTYEVKDMLKDTTYIHTGADLSTGFVIEIDEAPGAVLLQYTPAVKK